VKKCNNKGCSNQFVQYSTLQNKCIPCSIKKGRKIEAKIERKETRAAKEKIKKKGAWMKEAQAAYNRWVRARDYGKPCISCGLYIGELGIKSNIVLVCGHYLSVGAFPELRFQFFNTNLQCTRCNGGAGKYGQFNSKARTVTQDYRINLISKIGLENVEWLESKHEPKRYTIEDYKEIKTGFNAWARELEKADVHIEDFNDTTAGAGKA